MANLSINILTKYKGDGVKQAKEGFGSIGNALGQLGALTGVTLGAKELLEFGVQSFKAAEQARVTSTAFTNLSGSANIAAVNLAAMDRATKGLISDTEEMQIANQLLGMNIVQTGDQLEDVVTVSRRLGKEFKGLGAREAAEEFAIMIANMSVARLDSFGLSSGNVRKRIDELMATTEGMTREQAFFQATMEEGQKTMERLGPEVATTSDEVARLGSAWGDFQVFLGQTVEQSGLVSDFFKSLTGDITLLQNLLGDDSPDARIKALNVELEREGERLAMLEARGDGFFGIWAAGAEGAREHIAELQAELAGLEAEQQKVIEAGEKEQEQLQARIRSEEIAAENLAKRTEAEKQFAEAQDQFGRDIVDLQRKTDDELRDLQDRFVDDSLEAEEKHFEAMADIREKAAKDAEKAAKRLQKDLAKVDTGLKKDLLKQQIDEDKQIAKMQEKAAVEEKQVRRRKQIDAAADERLFQFELRQLAAEGQGNAIKEALERRAIEEQIASEKAEFEKTVETEKRKESIQSIREEGGERRMQLEEQAADRRADLQARAEEETQARAERLAEELTAEGEAYQERKDDLAEFLADQTEATKESQREQIQEIARGLAETEELTSTQLDNLVALAAEFGPKFGEAFADGVAQGFGENFKIDEAISKSGESLGAGAGPLPVASGTTNQSRGGIPVFDNGGTVDRSGIAWVDRGETISRQAGGITIQINAPVFGVDDLDNKLNAWGQHIVDRLAEQMN